MLLVRGDMPYQGESQGRLFSSSRDSSSEELQAIAEVAEGSFKSLEGAARSEISHAECRRDLGGNLGGKQASPVEQQRPGGRSRAEVASLAFARLKEATGVERAFLCGMLALPEASLPELPSRAFAGFVLVVQEPLDITHIPPRRLPPPPPCPWCRSASTHLDITPPPRYRRAGAALTRGDCARHGTAEIARAHPLGPRVRARAAGRAHAGLRHS